VSTSHNQSRKMPPIDFFRIVSRGLYCDRPSSRLVAGEEWWFNYPLEVLLFECLFLFVLSFVSFPSPFFLFVIARSFVEF